MIGGPIKRATRQWWQHAKEDLETATFLLRARKYLYVGFMCQQAVEKLLKGIICQELDILPPRTHNLISLADVIDARIADTQRILLSTLTEYYLNNRYPDVKMALSARMTKPVAEKLLRSTKEFLQWLMEQYAIPDR